MNLDAKIAAAVRCLEREYPKGVDPAALDDVITEITREHRAEFRQQLNARWQSVLSRLHGAFGRVLDDRVEAARSAASPQR